MHRTTFLRALTAAFAGLVLLAAPARADGLTPEQVATLVNDGKVAADITEPRVSPDGRHFTFLYDAHLRYQNPPPYDTFAPTCSDVWAARIDGSQLTRLTKTCDYRGTYESRGGGGDWSPDGSVLSWYSSYPSRIASSSRWRVALDDDGRDVWTSTSYAGFAAGYSSDGRYWLLVYQRSSGSGRSMRAVDVMTGAEHLVWDGWYPGDGHWSQDCATAATVAAGGEPTAAEIDAVLTGPDAACVFARVPKPVPTPVTGEDPTPTSPPTETTGPLSDRAPSPTSPAPAAVSPSATVAGATPVGGPTVQLLAITTSLRRAQARGFTVKYAAPGAKRVRAWVLRGQTVIARGGASSTNTGQLQLSGSAALRKLRLGSKSVQLVVRLAATDDQGRRTVLERPLSLRP